MNKNIKNIIRFSLAAILIVASLYYVFRDIDFKLLINIIANANYWWVIVSIPVIILSHWMRAVRWKTFLSPIEKSKSVWNLFSAVMVGYAVNNVLPRGGELVRPYVYARRQNVSKSAVFATIIVERVIDVVYLLLLFALAFFLMKDQIAEAFPVLDSQNIFLYIILPVLALILLILLSLYTSFAKIIIRIIIKPLSYSAYERANEILGKFLTGFEFIRTPSQYTRVLIESTMIWFLYAMPMYLMFNSFGFQDVLNLGIADAFLLLIVTGIGVSIAPTPGAIGVYHYLVVYAMTHLYTVTKEEAMAFATLVHALNMILQVIIGGGFLLRENIKKIPTDHDLEELEVSPQ